MRQRAKRLPKPVFDAIDGGATDEITLRANQTAYQELWLRPRPLEDVSTVDISTTVFGSTISMPLMLDPCGFARMAHPDAELAVRRAAGKAGTIFVASGTGSYPLEDVAAAGNGDLWYGLYLPSNREVTEDQLERAKAAGYGVMCVTIDSPIMGKRERDYRNRLTSPLRMSPRLVVSALSNPVWAANFALGRVARGGAYRSAKTAYKDFANTIQAAKPVTYADIAWLRQIWNGPFVVKGVQRGDECNAIVDLGVDGIIVSNHGARHLDTVRPTIDILPEVVAAVGDRAVIFVDGGVRRGTDVVKALALGARACLIGRPYMYGLAAGGEAGVRRVLEIFRTEITQAMALLGCRNVGEIDRSMVTAERRSLPRASPARRNVDSGFDLNHTRLTGKH
jgi:isopentenyl diphosphate isomerase/L-lactate dehydrogenase-like FMN-dependent dehydrogenase